MLLASNFFYGIWVGKSIRIPFELSVGMAFFVIVRTLNSPFSSFLNGIGKIKIQMYTSIFTGIINIPLSVLLAKYLHFGVAGVIYATTICFIIYLIVRIVQYYMIINNKAVGVWNQ